MINIYISYHYYYSCCCMTMCQVYSDKLQELTSFVILELSALLSAAWNREVTDTARKPLLLDTVSLMVYFPFKSNEQLGLLLEYRIICSFDYPQKHFVVQHYWV